MTKYLWNLLPWKITQLWLDSKKKWEMPLESRRALGCLLISGHNSISCLLLLKPLITQGPHRWRTASLHALLQQFHYTFYDLLSLPTFPSAKWHVTYTTWLLWKLAAIWHPGASPHSKKGYLICSLETFCSSLVLCLFSGCPLSVIYLPKEVGAAWAWAKKEYSAREA